MEIVTVKELKDAGLTFVTGDYHGCGRSLTSPDANNNRLVDNHAVTKLAWREYTQENPEFTGEAEFKRAEGRIMWRPKLHSIASKAMSAC